MSFFLQTVIGVAQLVAGFYGFWLVWRVLLPILPGPRDPENRIAPFDRYFTDPFVLPLAGLLRIHQRLVSAVLLLLVAARRSGSATSTPTFEATGDGNGRWRRSAPPDTRKGTVFMSVNDCSEETKALLVERLAEARERTRLLLVPVSDEDLVAQHDPIMSPLVWDYGHIGNYEELWLLKEAAGKELSARELYDMYDASLHPREERPSLDLLDCHDADRYLDAVRAAVVEALDEADLDGEDPLLADGFVYHMVLQHEAQHNETMLQTLQLMRGRGYHPERLVELPTGGSITDEMVHVPGGPFIMGTDDRVVALDNERGAHEVDVPGFYLDKTPVTNRRYLEFVEDGGYERPELWTAEGFKWIEEQRISAPKHWYQPEPHSWWTERFGFDEPLRPDAPVVHVCWYEADAYARWAGKRLPKEAEWEKAASWDPGTETKRLFPWGNEPPNPEKANLDQLSFSTSEVGAYPAGASAYGVLDMVGNVWEWTNSEFYGYPGFESFPYREYSEVFFDGGYRVLRGGSWATRPVAIRNTFRNWDHPIRRQLFCGFRCAKDV